MSIESIARRRAANTGESYAQALANVQARLEDMLRDTLKQPPEWEVDWCKEAPPPALTSDGADWVRGRPLLVQVVLRQFPPACVVRARAGVSLLIPFSRAGDEERRPGIVVGYSANGDDGQPSPDVRLIVSTGPRSGFTAVVDPEDVELVGCRSGQTVEWVEAVLAGPKP